MSYIPVEQKTPSGDVVVTKEVELDEGSETDIETSTGAESEESSLLNWKRQNHLPVPGQSLYHKILEAKAPLIVSIHFLILNLILSIALGSLLFKNSISQPAAPPAGTHPPGELLYTVGEEVIEHRVERTYVGPGYSEDYIPGPYQDWPNDENDALWRKYEDGNHIRLTKEEAGKLLHKTEHIPIEEHKDEYVVGLAVAVPVRSHVDEGGRVVDYTGRPFGREYNETWVLETPAGWAYIKDDMVL